MQRAERHLASVVESASDVIVSTDRAGKVVSWNAAAERITGQTSEEIVGRRFHELFLDSDAEAVRDAFEDVAALEGMGEPEWNLLTRTGEAVAISWVFSTMHDGEGDLVGVVALGRDLTERRRLEAQMLQSQKLAALGVMAGGIAHEIRNPLSVCSSAAQFLMEIPPTPEFLQECAEKIYKSAQRASSTIDNLLRFARPGKPNTIDEVDLGRIVRDTSELVRNQASLQKVEIKERIHDGSIRVLGNANMLQQMLMNIEMNALKAMPNGGTLEIALEEERRGWKISVADTGHGIPEEDLDKIFDPFHTRRSVKEGVGLGLSICYSIAQDHGGKIDVESTPERGTRFRIHLPRRREDVVEADVGR